MAITLRTWPMRCFDGLPSSTPQRATRAHESRSSRGERREPSRSPPGRLEERGQGETAKYRRSRRPHRREDDHARRPERRTDEADRTPGKMAANTIARLRSKVKQREVLIARRDHSEWTEIQSTAELKHTIMDRRIIPNRTSRHTRPRPDM